MLYRVRLAISEMDHTDTPVASVHQSLEIQIIKIMTKLFFSFMQYLHFWGRFVICKACNLFLYFTGFLFHSEILHGF